MPGLVEYVSGSYTDDEAIVRFYAALAWRPGWWAGAACRGLGPAPWFAEGARTLERRAIEQAAIELCRTCPVRGECAEAGASEPWGVWGGVRRDRVARRQVA